MADLASEIDSITREFTEFQGKLTQAMKMLEGVPEHGMMQELAQALAQAHAEVAKTAGPALDWMSQEEKELQAEIARTEAEIAELKKRLEAARAAATKPKAPAPPPKPPLVPGEGDPRYGHMLGDELLDLIGLGSQGEGKKPSLGEVWELESVDWKASASAAEGAPSAAPPKSPPRPQPRSNPDSLGGMQSTDFDADR